jgi:hypothetical protein
MMKIVTSLQRPWKATYTELVAHDYKILVIWKAEIGRIVVSGQPGQKKKKFVRSHLKAKKLSMVAYACHPSYSGKSWSRRHDPGWPRQKVRPYLQNNQKKKMDGSVAQMVECLPIKCEVLSSKPQYLKKKWNQKNRIQSQKD